jgi:peptidyl-tRNA hydrolase, PTH1 family
VRIVFGIGNPGRRYENTRHNIGFSILDKIAQQHNISFHPSRFDFYYSEGELEGFAFVLIKPSTYVNNSGLAVTQALNYYNTGLKDLLVVVDDINLMTGSLRVRATGGDGGHNGIKSIIYHLNSNGFPRIRVGIGSEFSKGEMADYVLSRFHKDDKELISSSTEKAITLVETFITGGIKQMLDYNSKNKL